jgi:hypothetical protein
MAPNDIIDISSLTSEEKSSRMYSNLLEALAMLDNRVSTYDEVDEMLYSLFGKFTGAKTTCVYWRKCLRRANIRVTCDDPRCDEKDVHRICSCKIHRKTKGIWLNRQTAKSVFKLSTTSSSNDTQ